MTGTVEDAVRELLASNDACIQVGSSFEVRHELGVTTLNFFPRGSGNTRTNLLSVAEVRSTYSAEALGRLDCGVIQAMNSRAIYGAFFKEKGRLCQCAQVSLFEGDTDPEFLTFLVLRAFWDQLAIGFATVRSFLEPAFINEARAWLGLPQGWSDEPDDDGISRTLVALNEHGYVGSRSDDNGFVFESILSGQCPTRMTDPTADTALVGVRTSIRHPVAGVGFYGTVAFPTAPNLGSAMTISEQLNALELRLDEFPPRIGAWSCRAGGREVVYSAFLPSSGLPLQLHGTLAAWLAHRAKWIADHHWGSNGFELFAGRAIC